eukprot:9436412-Pyramimonas_sp.AAC.1
MSSWKSCVITTTTTNDKGKGKTWDRWNCVTLTRGGRYLGAAVRVGAEQRRLLRDGDRLGISVHSC